MRRDLIAPAVRRRRAPVVVAHRRGRTMSTYDDEMPGEPLPSGFTPSVAGRLSPDALRRVMAKIDSVEAARARAAAEARTAWIGCTAR